MPPTPSLGGEPPLSEHGECTETCVCTGGARVCAAPEGDGRVKPVHTRESAHPARAPGSEFPRHASPGGGAGGSPKVRGASGPARRRDAGTLSPGTCVYPYAAETRVPGEALGQRTPYSRRPPSSAPQCEAWGLPESGVNLGYSSGTPARKLLFSEASGGYMGRSTVGSQRPGCFSFFSPPQPRPPRPALRISANPGPSENKAHLLDAPHSRRRATPPGNCTRPRPRAPNLALNNNLEIPSPALEHTPLLRQGPPPGEAQPGTWCRGGAVRRAPQRPPEPARR